MNVPYLSCDRVNVDGRDIFCGIRGHCRHLNPCRAGRLCLGSLVRVNILPQLKKQNADAFRITTAPSLGPVLGGAFAFGPGWRWIFWFLTIASGFCLLAMMLALPETHRAYIGNGGTQPPRLYRPFVPHIMIPWKGERGLKAPPLSRKPPKVPNPIKSLRILSRKDVAVSIMPGSFLYTVYCCIHASLATTFMDIYNLNKWQAGLIYLPFGLGAIVSTLVSSKWIDHDYRVVAKAHGLPINKVSGDDLLHFPIEEARIRSALLPTFFSFVSVLAYGWLVAKHTVRNATCTLVPIVDSISILRRLWRVSQLRGFPFKPVSMYVK